MSKTKYDIAYIRKYLSAELSAQEMHAFEKAAQDDPMLMDILLGMELALEKQIPVPYESIQQAMQDRLQEQVPKKMAFINWKWLSIAALFIAVVGASVFHFQMQPKQLLPNDARYPHQETADARQNNRIDQEDSLPISNEKQNRLAITQKPEKPSAKPKNRELNKLPKQVVAWTNEKRHIELKLDREDSYAYEIAAQQNKSADENLILRSSKRLSINSTVDTNLYDLAGQDRVVAATFDANPNQFLAQETISLQRNKFHAIGDSTKHATPDKNAVDSLFNSQSYAYLPANKHAKQNISSRPRKMHSPLQNNEQNIVVQVKSVPQDGKRLFKEYLRKATQNSIEKGKVTLQFALANDGSPTQIKILKSNNASLNKESIRILQDGPKWTVGKDAAQIEIVIRF